MYAGIVRPLLPCVESELLIIRRELPGEQCECCEGQDAVCERQGSRVGRGDQRWGGDEE